MATSGHKPKENLEQVRCPYDKSHILRKERLFVHLVKCRKNHPNTTKEVCQYNAIHVVERSHLEQHHKECPNRVEFDFTQLPKFDGSRLREVEAPSEENWDDCNEPTYDPLASIVDKPVLRTLKGAPPAARKAFRKEELKRLSELNRKRE